MRRKNRDPLQLVGYARASGDGALVATLHDVAVAPALRGRGLGRALMRRLMKQVLRTRDWPCKTPCESVLRLVSLMLSKSGGPEILLKVTMCAARAASANFVPHQHSARAPDPC